MCETRKEPPTPPKPPTGRIVREGGLPELSLSLVLALLFFVWMLFG